MRGEYAAHPRWVRPPRELPPRARRIPVTFYCVCYLSGTTSACAENTSSDAPAPTLSRNYLRVRGEYDHQPLIGFPEQELPPRARRIPPPLAAVVANDRTTSACAENTMFSSPKANSAWNYLRVRGEYTRHRWRGRLALELPPRARRIQLVRPPNPFGMGTTSACAENTHAHPQKPPTRGNYLRVRGEYTGVFAHHTNLPELPPRARRIQMALATIRNDTGTTSACAENTMLLDEIWRLIGNYLRVRGEYS